jgi:hypothetical protein
MNEQIRYESRFGVKLSNRLYLNQLIPCYTISSVLLRVTDWPGSSWMDTV